MIIKAGTFFALLLAAASAGVALFFFASLSGASPHRDVAGEHALRERDGRRMTRLPRPEGEGAGIAVQLACAG
jgi:hypothetical protein